MENKIFTCKKWRKNLFLIIAIKYHTLDIRHGIKTMNKKFFLSFSF